ncbi:MAG: hypothetical protein K1X44_08890 [Alphaproteobacteria bacterium]|nr:hypothetical protein [Alphaproteobacteria bacterium]
MNRKIILTLAVTVLIVSALNACGKKTNIGIGADGCIGGTGQGGGICYLPFPGNPGPDAGSDPTRGTRNLDHDAKERSSTQVEKDAPKPNT